MSGTLICKWVVPGLALWVIGCSASSEPQQDGEDAAQAEDSVASPLETAFSCAGFLGVACPEKYECVDDWRDDCDPKQGGADCSGVCEPGDGTRLCSDDAKCESNELCLIDPRVDCAPPADGEPMCLLGRCVLAACDDGWMAGDDGQVASASAYDCLTEWGCPAGQTPVRDGCGCGCAPDYD